MDSKRWAESSDDRRRKGLPPLQVLKEDHTEQSIKISNFRNTEHGTVRSKDSIGGTGRREDNIGKNWKAQKSRIRRLLRQKQTNMYLSAYTNIDCGIDTVVLSAYADFSAPPNSI
jgi:hypothetical protein